jgi:ATP-dependent DNA helicase RecQ
MTSERRHQPPGTACLAAALGLPFEPVLVRTEERPEQKDMANSAQQARNVDGSLSVVEQGIRGEPVLLVDDMVDSRWTLTIAAWLLRSHGSGEVRPFALAQAGGGG